MEPNLEPFQDIWGGGERENCLLPGICSSRTLHCLSVAWAGAWFWSSFRINSLTMFGRLTSRGFSAKWAGAISQGTSGSTNKTKSYMPITHWLPPSPLLMVLVKDPIPNRAVAKFLGYGAVSRYMARTRVGDSAASVWNYFLKMTLLGLGLNWSFTSSYLNPKAPTKPLCP